MHPFERRRLGGCVVRSDRAERRLCIQSYGIPVDAPIIERRQLCVQSNRMVRPLWLDLHPETAVYLHPLWLDLHPETAVHPYRM